MWYSALANPPKWLQRLIGPVHITNMPALLPLEEDDDEDAQGPQPQPQSADVEPPPSRNGPSHAIRWPDSYENLHRQYTAGIIRLASVVENEQVADNTALNSV